MRVSAHTATQTKAHLIRFLNITSTQTITTKQGNCYIVSKTLNVRNFQKLGMDEKCNRTKSETKPLSHNYQHSKLKFKTSETRQRGINKYIRASLFLQN